MAYERLDDAGKLLIDSITHSVRKQADEVIVDFALPKELAGRVYALQGINLDQLLGDAAGGSFQQIDTFHGYWNEKGFGTKTVFPFLGRGLNVVQAARSALMAGRAPGQFPNTDRLDGLKLLLEAALEKMSIVANAEWQSIRAI